MPSCPSKATPMRRSTQIPRNSSMFLYLNSAYSLLPAGANSCVTKECQISSPCGLQAFHNSSPYLLLRMSTICPIGLKRDFRRRIFPIACFDALAGMVLWYRFQAARGMAVKDSGVEGAFSSWSLKSCKLIPVILIEQYGMPYEMS